MAASHAVARRPAPASLQVVQALSLDVTAGVVCGALFASHVTGVQMPPAWWWLLPACTWLIYSCDRLLDARRIGPGAHSFRHRFYRRHAGLLTAITAAVALCATLGVSLLPLELVVPGALLAVAAGVHLTLAQRSAARSRSKELSAALVYTVGIWFGPAALGSTPVHELLPWIVLHGLAALGNLLLFSIFELQQDRNDGNPSLPLAWGAAHVRRLVYALAAYATALGLVLGVTSRPRVWPALAVLLVLNVVPAFMLSRRGRFESSGRYRAWGDLSFLLLALPVVLPEVVRHVG
ncbi:MAG: hypothetical protein GY716_18310 [bacterium]|nr:hypothetical protein [bacterium]